MKYLSIISLILFLFSTSFGSYIELSDIISGDTILIDTTLDQAWQLKSTSTNYQRISTEYELKLGINWKEFTADAIFEVSKGTLKNNTTKFPAGTVSSIQLSIPFYLSNLTKKPVDTVQVVAKNNNIVLLDTTVYVHFVEYTPDDKMAGWFRWDKVGGTVNFIDSAYTMWFTNYGSVYAIVDSGNTVAFRGSYDDYYGEIYFDNMKQMPIIRSQTHEFFQFNSEYIEEDLLIVPAEYQLTNEDYPFFCKDGSVWIDKYRYDGMFWKTFEHEPVIVTPSGTIYATDEQFVPYPATIVYVTHYFNGTEFVALPKKAKAGMLVNEKKLLYEFIYTEDSKKNLWLSGPKSKISQITLDEVIEYSLIAHSLASSGENIFAASEDNVVYELSNGSFTKATADDGKDVRATRLYNDSVGGVWAYYDTDYADELYYWKDGSWTGPHFSSLYDSKFIVGKNGIVWMIGQKNIYYWNGIGWSKVFKSNMDYPYDGFVNQGEVAPNGDLWVPSKFNKYCRVKSPLYKDAAVSNSPILSSAKASVKPGVIQIKNHAISFSNFSNCKMGTYSIISPSGRVMYKQEIHFENGISTDALPNHLSSGFYIIQLSSDNFITTEKVLLVK